MANLRYRATPTTYTDGDLVDGLTDINGRLQVTGVSGGSSSVTTIGNGTRTVTTAGTDVPLSASSVACSWVTIEAYRANTGYIAVGGTGVDAAAAAGTGVTLAAGDAVNVPVNNLNGVYIDATVSGEGVRYTYGV